MHPLFFGLLTCCILVHECHSRARVCIQPCVLIFVPLDVTAQAHAFAHSTIHHTFPAKVQLPEGPKLASSLTLTSALPLTIFEPSPLLSTLEPDPLLVVMLLPNPWPDPSTLVESLSQPSMSHKFESTPGIYYQSRAVEPLGIVFEVVRKYSLAHTTARCSEHRHSISLVITRANTGSHAA
jgi:hypothetical protein